MRPLFFRRYNIDMGLLVFLVSLEFRSEKVECWVKADDTLQVSASYTMVAAPTSKFCLMFPLPEEGVDFRVIGAENCQLKDQGDVQTLCLHFGQDSVMQVKVVYSQRFPDRVYRYITTTTKAWGKPLQSAKFVVKTPWPADISYRADSVKQDSTGYTYWVDFEDFWPEQDLIFQPAENK